MQMGGAGSELTHPSIATSAIATTVGGAGYIKQLRSPKALSFFVVLVLEYGLLVILGRVVAS